jgi:hypothetical protein
VVLPAAIGVVVLVAVAVVWVTTRSRGNVTRSPWPVAPEGGQFLSWPATGDDLGNRDLVARATQVWSAYPQVPQGMTGPHSDVTPLLVQRRSPVGPIVVLQGLDSHQMPRLAVITGSRDPGVTPETALQLRADRPSPDPHTTRQVSLVSARLAAEPGRLTQDRAVLAFVLAEPGTTNLTLHSPLGAPRSAEKTGNERLTMATLEPDASAYSTTITGTNTTGERWSIFADDLTIGEAHAQPITLLGKPTLDHAQVTLTSESAPVTQPGQLVAARQGLIGRVVRHDGRIADIELISNPGFEIPAVARNGDLALARTNASRQLTIGVRTSAADEMIYAIHTFGPNTGDTIRIPLGTAGAETSTTPSAASAGWRERIHVLSPAADLATNPGPLYILVAGPSV